MKVLVVPEDPMLDQYILKPVVERLFADLGLAVRVNVLWNPRLRSVNQALDSSVVRDIVNIYSMIDLFLLIVDRDADEHRAKRARMRETEHPGRLLACLAIEEVEVWMLALDAGQGRKWAMRDLGARWKGLLDVCPEIAELKTRIAGEIGRRS